MSKSITFRFSVTATLPLTDDQHHPDFYTEAQATSTVFRHNLEKTIHRAIRRIDGGDWDVELMEHTVTDDDPHGASCICEICGMERAADTALEANRD